MGGILLLWLCIFMFITIFTRAQTTRLSQIRAFLPILFIGAANIGRSQESLPKLDSLSPGAEISNDVQIGDNAMVKVNFPSAPIQAIIPFYSSLTRKKLILDSSLQGEQLRIISPEPLSKKEAIAFIEATLLLNGYALINIDSTTAKLINNGAGKSPTADGLKVYHNIRDLPPNEEICHFVLQLNHISGEDASKAFQEVIKLHPYGAISAISNNSALIITENSTTIRSIHELAQVIDVPSANISNEMIRLERSDVELVAEIITEIFGQDKKAENDSPEAKSNIVPTKTEGVNPAGPVQGQNSQNANPASSNVKVFAYRRTNELLVIGRPVDITYIKGLVEKLDKQDHTTNFLKRRLKWLKVQDFISVAYNALAKDTDIQNSDGSASNGGGRRKATPKRNDADALSGGNPARNSPESLSGNAGNLDGNINTGGASSGSNGTNSSRSSLSSPEETGAPESIIVGKTLLISDPQSNSLVVSGSPEHVSRIDQLLEEMDVRPQQIYISAIIGQLSLGKNYNYGFDFLKLLDDFSIRQTSDDSSSSSGIASLGGSFSSGGGQASQIANFSWNRLNLYGQIGSLSSYLKLIEGANDFKVLATPSVYAKNASKSVISSGQKIAVPAQILSNGGFQSGVINNSVSVDYRDVLLKLEVIPLINSDDEVTLRIAQVNDNIVGSQTISGNTVPTIGTQQLVTEVSIKNDSTVVLGGLITERSSNEGRGGIFLRRIPIIKNLFGTTTIESKREELLIFIQPHIIKNDDSGDNPNAIEAERSSLFKETVDFSTPSLEDIPKAMPYRE